MVCGKSEFRFFSDGEGFSLDSRIAGFESWNRRMRVRGYGNFLRKAGRGLPTGSALEVIKKPDGSPCFGFPDGHGYETAAAVVGNVLQVGG